MTQKRTRTSAGILLYRLRSGRIEVLIGHLGGPFWSGRESAAWSLPKGEYDPAEEDPWTAARREWTEELGLPVPPGEPDDLGEVRQSGGKRVRCYALRGDLDPATVVPGTFALEWPPRSGTVRDFPELDRVGWYALPRAADLLILAQREFLDRLAEHVGRVEEPPAEAGDSGD